MPKVKKIAGLRDSRWGIHPKQASKPVDDGANALSDGSEGVDSSVKQEDDAVDGIDVLDHVTSPSDSVSEDNVQQNLDEELANNLFEPQGHTRPDLSHDDDDDSNKVFMEDHAPSDSKSSAAATITDLEWSAIEKASAELQEDGVEESMDTDETGASNNNGGDDENTAGETAIPQSGGGDQIGAEALLDLGKPNSTIPTEDGDETPKEGADEGDTVIPLNTSFLEENTHLKRQLDSFRPVPLSVSSAEQALATNTVSKLSYSQDDLSITSSPVSKKQKRSNSSSSLSGIIASTSTAASVSDNAQSNTAPTTSSQIEADLHELFDNPENPNWQKFYADSMSSDMIVDSASRALSSASATITSSGISTVAAAIKSKRGRKRKSLEGDAKEKNSLDPRTNSNVDPALEQLDMSAAAAAAAAAVREQSQLEDAMMHASAIVRTIYDDSIIPEVEKSVKRRNAPRSHESLSAPPSSSAQQQDEEGDDVEAASPASAAALDEAFRISRVKYHDSPSEAETEERGDGEQGRVSAGSDSSSSFYWNQQQPHQSPDYADQPEAGVGADLNTPSARGRKKRNVVMLQKPNVDDSLSHASAKSALQSATSAAVSSRTRRTKRLATAAECSIVVSSSISKTRPHSSDLIVDEDKISRIQQSVVDPSSLPPPVDHDPVTSTGLIEQTAGNWRAQPILPERGGNFTQEEMGMLDDFMSRYCLLHNMTRDALCRRVWSNERKKDNFWDEISVVLPHRSRASVYKHIRRAYHVFESRGKWTQEEEERLSRLYAEKGAQWKVIGIEMSRMPEDCRDRWRNYVKCGTNRVQNKWSTTEETRLREIVSQILTESPDTDINWTAVSELMGSTRSRIQCRYKWNKIIKRATTAKIEAMMSDDKLALLRYILENGYEDETQVDWDGFAAMDSRGFWTGKELQMAFERLKPKGNADLLSRSFRGLVRAVYDDLFLYTKSQKNEGDIDQRLLVTKTHVAPLVSSSAPSIDNVPASQEEVAAAAAVAATGGASSIAALPSASYMATLTDSHAGQATSLLGAKPTKDSAQALANAVAEAIRDGDGHNASNKNVSDSTAAAASFPSLNDSVNAILDRAAASSSAPAENSTKDSIDGAGVQVEEGGIKAAVDNNGSQLGRSSRRDNASNTGKEFVEQHEFSEGAASHGDEGGRSDPQKDSEEDLMAVAAAAMSVSTHHE